MAFRFSVRHAGAAIAFLAFAVLTESDAFRAGAPFLDRPGKPGLASPGGKLGWREAGRRQWSGSGRSDAAG